MPFSSVVVYVLSQGQSLMRLLFPRPLFMLGLWAIVRHFNDSLIAIVNKEKVELRSNEAQETCPIASQHSSLLRCDSRMRTCGKKETNLGRRPSLYDLPSETQSKGRGQGIWRQRRDRFKPNLLTFRYIALCRGSSPMQFKQDRIQSSRRLPYGYLVTSSRLSSLCILLSLGQLAAIWPFSLQL